MNIYALKDMQEKGFFFLFFFPPRERERVCVHVFSSLKVMVIRRVWASLTFEYMHSHMNLCMYTLYLILAKRPRKVYMYTLYINNKYAQYAELGKP